MGILAPGTSRNKGERMLELIGLCTILFLAVKYASVLLAALFKALAYILLFLITLALLPDILKVAGESLNWLRSIMIDQLTGGYDIVMIGSIL